MWDYQIRFFAFVKRPQDNYVTLKSKFKFCYSSNELSGLAFVEFTWKKIYLLFIKAPISL